MKKYQFWQYAIAVFIVLCGITTNIQAQNDQVLTVSYLPPAEELSFLKEYNYELLKLALEKTEKESGPFKIEYKEQDLQQRDALKSLGKNDKLQVVPTMTDVYRERIFMPIRIPLYKGLFGVRLFMTKADNSFRGSIYAKGDLDKHSIGQGETWPDTRILEANDLEVVTFNDKEAIFTALKKEEITLFPRSVIEIFREIDDYSSDNFDYYRGAYIYYPTAVYFFTQKNQQGLALSKRIREGLNMAINDGSFNKLFNSYFKDLINKANLEDMRMISLENPLLPEMTPVSDTKLWYIQR